MVWGVDLGGQLALSAVACFWPETGLLDTLAECGNALTMAQRGAQAAVKLAHVRSARKLVLLEAGIADAVVVTDSSGNAKLAKVKEGGRRAHARDDVAAAAILAVAHGARVRGAETARPNRPSAVIVG